MNKNSIEHQLKQIHKKHIFDDVPVFCFTSDIDWASEDVMHEYFNIIDDLDIPLTLFVTHHSNWINTYFKNGKIERGIHPNFMNGSSHGANYKEIIETCIRFAPEAYGFRSHRAYEVTDVTHLLKNDYNFKYVSHQITVFQQFVRPVLHESGLIGFPVFFEDGTHLYNKLELDIKTYLNYFTKPGIKVISFHPMNFVFNSHTLYFMRSIKNSLSREEYNNISYETIGFMQNKNYGIRNTIMDIINFVKQKNYPILSLNKLYNNIIK